EDKGKFMMTVFPGGGIVHPRDYLEQRRQAALTGKVFNPPVGFAPIGQTGREYPFDFVKGNFEPRVAVAWQPKFTSGLFGKLFGDGKTVLRGGYWHFYDRLNGVQTAIDPLQAVGFGQSLVCLGRSSSAGTTVDCRGNSGTTPATAFRVGPDGSTVLLPTIPQTITAPAVPGNVLVPGANIPFVPSSQVQDPQWKPGSHNAWDITIQRELPGKGRVEVGYVGHTARNIYQGIDLNQVPFFMVAGGQSFAQAFDLLAQQIISKAAITPQPFFETSLAGSSTFCAPKFANCTAGVP